MKKISIFLLLFLSLMIRGYTEETFEKYQTEETFEKYQIFTLENLYNHEEFTTFSDIPFEDQIEQILENWQDNWVIEITQGLEIPLNLNLKGEFFHLDPEDNFVSIFVDKTFYFRIVGQEDVLLSTDLITWVDAEDFFTGQIDVEYLNHKNKSFIKFLLELNQR